MNNPKDVTADALEIEIISFEEEIEEVGLYLAYGKIISQTAQYPKGIVYPALGLLGEIGEYIETDGNDPRECGDICWYVGALCREYIIPIDRVLDADIAKTRDFWTLILTATQIAERTKKILRDREGVPNEKDRAFMLEMLIKMVSQLKRECIDEADFHQTLKNNSFKLLDRLVRDMIKGDGNDR